MRCRYQVWSKNNPGRRFEAWVSSPADMLAKARERLNDPSIQMGDLRFEHLRNYCCNA